MHSSLCVPLHCSHAQHCCRLTTAECKQHQKQGVRAQAGRHKKLGCQRCSTACDRLLQQVSKRVGARRGGSTLLRCRHRLHARACKATKVIWQHGLPCRSCCSKAVAARKVSKAARLLRTHGGTAPAASTAHARHSTVSVAHRLLRPPSNASQIGEHVLRQGAGHACCHSGRRWLGRGSSRRRGCSRHGQGCKRVCGRRWPRLLRCSGCRSGAVEATQQVQRCSRRGCGGRCTKCTPRRLLLLLGGGCRGCKWIKARGGGGRRRGQRRRSRLLQPSQKVNVCRCSGGGSCCGCRVGRGGTRGSRGRLHRDLEPQRGCDLGVHSHVCQLLLAMVRGSCRAGEGEESGDSSISSSQVGKP